MDLSENLSIRQQIKRNLLNVDTYHEIQSVIEDDIDSACYNEELKNELNNLPTWQLDAIFASIIANAGFGQRTLVRQRVNALQRAIRDIPIPESNVTIFESIPSPKLKRTTVERNELTWVYKAFNKRGDLLYVGITNNPKNRLREHKDDSIWWEDKDQMTWDMYETRGQAETAELLSIRTENPVFNITGRI